jgi:hypothetical protein
VSRNVLLLLVGDADPVRLREALAARLDGPVRIHVVAPAQVRPLDWFATADDDAQREAEVRALEAEWTLAEQGDVEGGAGDLDPVQAVEDALRSFDADAIVVAGDRAAPELETTLARFGRPVERLGSLAALRPGFLARTFRGLAAGRNEAIPFAVFVGVNVALLLLGVVLAALVALIVWLFF